MDEEGSAMSDGTVYTRLAAGGFDGSKCVRSMGMVFSVGRLAVEQIGRGRCTYRLRITPHRHALHTRASLFTSLKL